MSIEEFYSISPLKKDLDVTERERKIHFHENIEVYGAIGISTLYILFSLYVKYRTEGFCFKKFYKDSTFKKLAIKIHKLHSGMPIWVDETHINLVFYGLLQEGYLDIIKNAVGQDDKDCFAVRRGGNLVDYVDGYDFMQEIPIDKERVPQQVNDMDDYVKGIRLMETDLTPLTDACQSIIQDFMDKGVDFGLLYTYRYEPEWFVGYVDDEVKDTLENKLKFDRAGISITNKKYWFHPETENDWVDEEPDSTGKEYWEGSGPRNNVTKYCFSKYYDVDYTSLGIPLPGNKLCNLDSFLIDLPRFSKSLYSRYSTSLDLAGTICDQVYAQICKGLSKIKFKKKRTAEHVRKYSIYEGETFNSFTVNHSFGCSNDYPTYREDRGPPYWEPAKNSAEQTTSRVRKRESKRISIRYLALLYIEFKLHDLRHNNGEFAKPVKTFLRSWSEMYSHVKRGAKERMDDMDPSYIDPSSVDYSSYLKSHYDFYHTLSKCTADKTPKDWPSDDIHVKVRVPPEFVEVLYFNFHFDPHLNLEMREL